MISWLLVIAIVLISTKVFAYQRAFITRRTLAPRPLQATIDDDLDSSNKLPIYEGDDTEKTFEVEVRDEDFNQDRELELILTERAKRFYDPKTVGIEKERCVLVGVNSKTDERKAQRDPSRVFTFMDSLNELSELVGTAGLQVVSTCIQRLNTPFSATYIGTGKCYEVMVALNQSNSRTIVVDDDLTPKQTRNLEDIFASHGGPDVKILDRTAVILEIFAQHAQSREGQLQVELAMLEYRLTRGPRATGGERDSGAGFRGPGESKLETDKRVIRDKIVKVKREISGMGGQREMHRSSRDRLGLPVVALVGYTNAGKSTLLNRLSRAGVLAENMLFATLDPTTRRVQLPKAKSLKSDNEDAGHGSDEGSEASADDQTFSKGQEILLTDTVGFISKLPTDLIAAFRATLEEVSQADVLIHVCDRSNPAWEKQKEAVLKELDAVGCTDTPIVELWNKIDCMESPEGVMLEAMTVPVDIDAEISTSSSDLVESSSERGPTAALGEGSTFDDSLSEIDFDMLHDGDGPLIGIAESGGTADTMATGDDMRKREVGSNRRNSLNADDAPPASQRQAGRQGSGEASIGDNFRKTPTLRASRKQVEDIYEWDEEDEYVRGTVDDLSDDTSNESADPIGHPLEDTPLVVLGAYGSTRRKGPERSVFKRPERPTFVVAASAKTGLGFEDFVGTLEDALCLLMRPIDVFIPYNQDDGIIAKIHSQGIVEAMDYADSGTHVSCRVPEPLYQKLLSYKVD